MAAMEPMVSLVDAGITPGQCAQRGYVVGVDWQGEPAIRMTDAASWAAERRTADARHDQDQADWRQQTEEYEASRLAVARAAGRNAWDAAIAEGNSHGAAQGYQREAYLHAGRQFERTYKRPRYAGDGEPGTSLLFVPEHEEGSRVFRVLGKLRGPAKPAQPVLVTEVA